MGLEEEVCGLSPVSSSLSGFSQQADHRVLCKGNAGVLGTSRRTSTSSVLNLSPEGRSRRTSLHGALSPLDLSPRSRRSTLARSRRASTTSLERRGPRAAGGVVGATIAAATGELSPLDLSPRSMAAVRSQRASATTGVGALSPLDLTPRSLAARSRRSSARYVSSLGGVFNYAGHFGEESEDDAQERGLMSPLDLSPRSAAVQSRRRSSAVSLLDLSPRSSKVSRRASRKSRISTVGFADDRGDSRSRHISAAIGTGVGRTSAVGCLRASSAHTSLGISARACHLGMLPIRTWEYPLSAREKHCRTLALFDMELGKADGNLKKARSVVIKLSEERAALQAEIDWLTTERGHYMEQALSTSLIDPEQSAVVHDESMTADASSDWSPLCASLYVGLLVTRVLIKQGAACRKECPAGGGDNWRVAGERASGQHLMFKTLEVQVAELTAQLEAREKDCRDFEVMVATGNEQMRQTGEATEDCTHHLQRQVEENTELQDSLTTCKQEFLRTKEELFAAKRQRIEEVAELRSHLAASDAMCDDAKAAVKSMLEQRKKDKEGMQDMERKLRIAESKHEELRVQGACSEGGRAGSAEFARLQELVSELDPLKAKLAVVSEEHAEEVASLRTQLAEVEEGKAQLATASEVLHWTEQRLSSAEDCSQEHAREAANLRQQLANAEELKTQLATASEAQQLTEQRLSSAEEHAREAASLREQLAQAENLNTQLATTSEALHQTKLRLLDAELCSQERAEEAACLHKQASEVEEWKTQLATASEALQRTEQRLSSAESCSQDVEQRLHLEESTSKELKAQMGFSEDNLASAMQQQAAEVTQLQQQVVQLREELLNTKAQCCNDVSASSGREASSGLRSWIPRRLLLIACCAAFRELALPLLSRHLASDYVAEAVVGNAPEPSGLQEVHFEDTPVAPVAYPAADVASACAEQPTEEVQVDDAPVTYATADMTSTLDEKATKRTFVTEGVVLIDGAAANDGAALVESSSNEEEPERNVAKADHANHVGEVSEQASGMREVASKLRRGPIPVVAAGAFGFVASVFAWLA